MRVKTSPFFYAFGGGGVPSFRARRARESPDTKSNNDQGDLLAALEMTAGAALEMTAGTRAGGRGTLIVLFSFVIKKGEMWGKMEKKAENSR